MELTLTILCVLLSLAVLWIYKQRGKYKLPPGPRGLPLIGSILDISSSSLHVYSAELSKTYGDIISINMLGETCLVLNSLSAIREAFFSEKFAAVFAGRSSRFLQYTNMGRNSTSFTPISPEWVKQRKMLHKTLKVYGEGVMEMESIVQQELEHVVEWITKQNTKEFRLGEILHFSLQNFIAILQVGRRLEYDSEEMQTIISVTETFAPLGSLWEERLLTACPFLLRLPVGIGRRYALYYEAERRYNEAFYYKQKATYDPNLTRGLIDVMLRTQEESRDEGGTTWLTDDKIRAISGELILAGVETTHSALMSIVLIMLHRPDVRDKIADEIEQVVGGDRAPRLNDRPEMPYTEAAMLELLRFISHVPLALPHSTTRDVTFRDFTIPANTTVFANCWAVHHDGNVWPNPWKFQPERFLDDNGKLVSVDHINRRNLMAFGTGKRSCVGAVFAKSRLFLFVTTLVQRFTFEPAGDKPVPSYDPRAFTGNVVLSPQEYWVIAKPRE